MSIKKSEFFLPLAAFLLLCLALSLIWTQSAWLLLLVTAALAVLFLSFVLPRPAFIALIILRTATDFLTTANIFTVGSWSLNYTSLLGVIAIIFALATIWRQKLWRELPPLAVNWLLFLGLATILTIFSSYPAVGLVETLRWSSFFSLFVLGFALFRGGPQSSNLVKAIIASAALPVAAALWQSLSGQEFFDGERWRVLGTFTHPNMLAFYLVYVSVLTLFIFLTLDKGAKQKYLYFLISLPLLSALLLTYTRGAWLAFFLVIVLIGLFRFRRFLITVTLAISLLYLSLLPFQTRVASLTNLSATDSAAWRLDLWRDAWGYAQKNIWLGSGPGTAPLIIAANRPINLGSTEPHNDYIKIVLEMGLIGVGIYLSLIISLLWHLLKAWRQEVWPRRQLLFLFLAVFSLALYGASIGDNILKDSPLQWSFWALIGSLMYSYGQIKKSSNDLTTK